MNAKTFFEKVAYMRKCQKEYYKTRSKEALKASLAIENEIDKEIERVNQILAKSNQPKQTSIFNQ